jgi:zinc protease
MTDQPYLQSLSTFQATVHETLLDNGLRVLLKSDHALPVVTVMLWYRTGSGNEAGFPTGISHFLEHMLFKGSTHFPRGEIDRLTLSGGGENNAYTWIDNTAYYFNFASDRWQIALEIEADRMRNCLLDPIEVEAERQVILEEWRTAKDDPEENLWDAVTTTALGLHPYRNPVLGWVEDIQTISAEDLSNYYQTWYHPNHATLVIVGDIQIEAALEKVKQSFAAIAPGPTFSRPQMTEPKQTQERRISLTQADVTLPRLAVAWHAPAIEHPDYYALTLLQYILAEGLSSILYQALVEREQVATDIDAAGFETKQPYLFWIAVDGEAGIPLARTEAKLFAELSKFQNGEWEASHLIKAQNQILTDFYLSLETSEDQAEVLGELASLSQWQNLDQFVPQIQAVTVADVTRVAQTWLAPETRTVGWLLPESEDPDEQAESSAKSSLSDRQHSRPQEHRIQSFTHSPLPEPHLWFPSIEAERVQLANGMTLLVHENRRIPTVSLEVFWPAGSWHDPLKQKGLANLTASALIKGTQRRPGVELARYLESLGGSLSISTGLNGSFLGIEILAVHLDIALDLMREILTEPGLEEAEILREKRLILSDLETAEEQASYLASRAFYEHIYGDFPAAWPESGLRKTVETLTPKDVSQFFHDWVGSQGAILAISGAVSAPATLAKVTQLWSDWQPSPGIASQYPLPFKQKSPQTQLIRLAGKEQCQVYWGHLGIERKHPDFAALQILDLVLGAGPGFTSRLPARLREQEGLAYSAGSSITGSAGLYPGVFMAWMETRPEGVAPGLRAMREEVDKIQQEGISLLELQRARAYLSGRLPFRFETNDQRVGFLLQREIYAWPENHLQTHWQALENLSPEDIQTAACRHLHPESSTLVIAGADSGFTID